MRTTSRTKTGGFTGFTGTGKTSTVVLTTAEAKAQYDRVIDTARKATALREEAKAGKVKAFTAYVHPEAFAALMDGCENRPLRKTNLWVDAIRQDSFILTGDSLVITPDGKMRNGFHRATASIITNTPVPVTILLGAPYGNIVTTDTNWVRSIKDTFFYAGIENPGVRSKATDQHRKYFVATEAGGETAIGNVHKLATPERQSLLDWYRNNPVSDEIIEFRNDVQTTLGATYKERFEDRPQISRDGLLVARMITDGVDEADSAAFWNGLLTGEGVLKNGPISALYDYLTQHQRTSARWAALVAVTITAWNAYREQPPRPLNAEQLAAVSERDTAPVAH
jgi:hypothetical protein